MPAPLPRLPHARRAALRRGLEPWPALRGLRGRWSGICPSCRRRAGRPPIASGAHEGGRGVVGGFTVSSSTWSGAPARCLDCAEDAPLLKPHPLAAALLLKERDKGNLIELRDRAAAPAAARPTSFSSRLWSRTPFCWDCREDTLPPPPPRRRRTVPGADRTREGIDPGLRASGRASDTDLLQRGPDMRAMRRRLGLSEIEETAGT